jgi:hypothetical protein
MGCTDTSEKCKIFPSRLVNNLRPLLNKMVLAKCGYKYFLVGLKPQRELLFAKQNEHFQMMCPSELVPD